MHKNKAREDMIKIFKSGIKNKSEKLGVEFEHFIIDKDSLESCDYNNGVKQVMTKLSNKGWQPINSDLEEILGLTRDGHYITLEPGGQIEISLKPYKDINDIRVIYSEILDEIKSTLESNQRIIGIGYHPKSRIQSLDILPKVRYHQMYEYFKSCGSYAHYMMKGTASTQVAIDYASQDDFIKKFRVANFLSPFLYRIFDASPIFEGKVYKKNNLRLDIWDNTDNCRCGIPNNALTNKSYGFKDYSQYILETPPIFLKQGEEYVFTGQKKLSEIIENTENKDLDLEYILGMVFPDTRLKKYIELRMPDALPYPLGLAVPALIKGIFYNQKNLDKYYGLSLEFDNDDYMKLKELLKENLDIQYKGIEGNQMLNELFEDAIRELKSDESVEIFEVKRIINSYGSISNFLKKLFKTDKDKFISLITGGL